MAAIYRLRDAMLRAGAELLNTFGGLLMTRLTADLPPAPVGASPPAEALRADVETTYGFPTAAKIVVGAETIPYTGTTASRFTGLARDDAVRATARRGDLVVLHAADGSAAYSDLDRARQMVFVQTAEADFLDVVGNNYGVPRYFDADDVTYRALIRALAFQPGKGTRTAIGEFLDVALSGQGLAGDDGELDAAAHTLTSTAGLFTTDMRRLRVRLTGADPLNARVVRILDVTDANTLLLDRHGSPEWEPADLADEEDVAWEIVYWDAWWSPVEADRGVAFIRLNLPRPDDAVGATWVHVSESATSSAVDTAVVSHEVRQVLGVWLATDAERSGTNYATNNDFDGDTITLDTDLPGAATAVVVDYGFVEEPASAPTPGVPGAADAEGTAQILEGVSERNSGDPLPYDPAYIGDRGDYLRRLIDLLVIAGVEPRLSVHLY